MRICRGGAFLLLLAGLLSGCAGFVDEEEGQVPTTEFSNLRKGEVPVQRGYLGGQVVEYYRFDTFKPGSASWFPPYTKFPGVPVGDMYILADEDGKIDLATTGQDPIIDVLPGQAHYTDFFELVAFRPDGDYTPNDIKSRGTLVLAEHELTRTRGIVHCPLVDAGATLSNKHGTIPAPADPNRPEAWKFRLDYKPIKVWYRKKVAYCMLLDGGHYLKPGGMLPTAKATATVGGGRFLISVPATEVYTMITSAFTGADQVSNIPVPGNDIFRHGRNEAKYSPVVQIWDVTVPSDYKVGARTSYAELFPVKDFTDPGIVKRNPDAFFVNTLITVGTAK